MVFVLLQTHRSVGWTGQGFCLASNTQKCGLDDPRFLSCFKHTEVWAGRSKFFVLLQTHRSVGWTIQGFCLASNTQKCGLDDPRFLLCFKHTEVWAGRSKVFALLQTHRSVGWTGQGFCLASNTQKCGLDYPRFESGKEKNLSLLNKVETHAAPFLQPLIWWVPVFFARVKRPDITNVYVVPRLRMSGTISLLATCSHGVGDNCVLFSSKLYK
jgi:hypothetical protein